MGVTSLFRVLSDEVKVFLHRSLERNCDDFYDHQEVFITDDDDF